MHVVIISWQTMRKKAAFIAEKLHPLADKLTVIYSNECDFNETGCGEWVKVPNDFFFGKKFKEALDLHNQGPMLIIQADAQMDHWPQLIERARIIEKNSMIGVWAPDVDYTPWLSEFVNISFDEKSKLSFAVQTDGIVFYISEKVIERMKIINYDCNNLGWGIDWAAICYSYVNNLCVIKDYNLKVTHVRGSGYDKKGARDQMLEFLNENQTLQEKLIYKLLLGYVDKNKLINDVPI